MITIVHTFVYLGIEMKEYKNPFCIRHAHLSCPLPLAVESYWACDADCHHCPGRKLNEIWGNEQRVTDPRKVDAKLRHALEVKNPKSPLAVALSLRKTLWLGRKTDPYQPLEQKLRVTRDIIKALTALDWSYVVCSRYTQLMMRDERLYQRGRATLLVEVTPGGESDWELFERQRTTPVEDRLVMAAHWIKAGIHVGIRGEPFIPGYHTPQQFRTMLRRLKSHGLTSYNTYNMHLNEYNARRLASIGLDVEKIWRHNQDARWRPIQQKLCQIADEEGIVLGCPDFVNVPKGWVSRTNTCCGVSVENPFRFNTHTWRKLLQKGKTPKQVLHRTWECIGSESDHTLGQAIIEGKKTDHYTMKDAEL